MDTPSPEKSVPSQEIRINTSNPPSTSTVHLLPCKVECKGEDDCSSAKVDTYFTPTIRPTNETINLSTSAEKQQKVYTATFRGRGLKGVTAAVPDGFTGVVLKEINQSSEEEVWQQAFCTLPNVLSCLSIIIIVLFSFSCPSEVIKPKVYLHS